ncbi:MAG: TlpA family protein disulfide reductase [Deltaproteobacteria bacterium]|nr:TlpA family protein disulfide reductase [Deltaproteobacteria bacterium]
MRIALALAAFALGGCATAGGLARVSPHVGRPLVLTAPGLDGKTVDVAAEQGKVRVVDFWATWCEPCKEELPALDKLARQHAGRGLAVYGVSFDEDREQIPEFLARLAVSFPILWDRGGDRLSQQYGVARLPTTLIVDRRGFIRFVHEGWSESRAAEQRREVELLLEER